MGHIAHSYGSTDLAELENDNGLMTLAATRGPVRGKRSAREIRQPCLFFLFHTCFIIITFAYPPLFF